MLWIVHLFLSPQIHRYEVEADDPEAARAAALSMFETGDRRPITPGPWRIAIATPQVGLSELYAAEPTHGVLEAARHVYDEWARYQQDENVEFDVVVRAMTLVLHPALDRAERMSEGPDAA